MGSLPLPPAPRGIALAVTLEIHRSPATSGNADIISSVSAAAALATALVTARTKTSFTGEVCVSAVFALAIALAEAAITTDATII